MSLANRDLVRRNETFYPANVTHRSMSTFWTRRRQLMMKRYASIIIIIIIKKTGRTQLKTMHAITSKINKNRPITNQQSAMMKTDAGTCASVSVSLLTTSSRLSNHFLLYSDRSPVPVISAVQSNITFWSAQNLLQTVLIQTIGFSVNVFIQCSCYKVFHFIYW